MENINKTIHEKVVGECWHSYEWSPTDEQMDDGRYLPPYRCVHCADRANAVLVNPAYDSPDSPRSLLDGAVSKAIERFGPGAVGKKLARILETDGTTERLGELGAIATAPPDAICRAILALYSEGEGEQK